MISGFPLINQLEQRILYLITAAINVNNTLGFPIQTIWRITITTVATAKKVIKENVCFVHYDKRSCL